MDEHDRRIRLVEEAGLWSETLGHPVDWDPQPRDVYQVRHDQFWKSVSGIMPDDEHDEPYWMTEKATAALESNN